MYIKIKLLLVFLLLYRLIAYDNTLPEGKNIRMTGNIQKEVQTYDHSQRIVVRSHSMYVDKFPKLYYGDFVVIEGMVKDGLLKNVKVVNIKEGKGIYNFRKRLVAIIKNSLPIKDGALVAGMILGSKQLLTKGFNEDLIDSGTIHVVVASGTNVTLTASFMIMLLVRFFKRKVAIIGALIGIWIYVVLSGFDAPLIRAAIMGTIAFSAQGMGRINTAIDGLLASAVIMLIFMPEWIMDIGFQLSFFATLSLILFDTYLNSKLYFVPSVLRQDLSTSLSAQIGVSPLLAHYFGRVNVLSPIVNMLVLWTVPFIMIIGSVALFVSLISPEIGSILFLSILPFTQFFISVITFFA